MRVCGVQNNNYQNYQKPVKFTGNFATVYAENGRDILYKKYTASFREPFDWEKYPKFLYEWFKDAMSVIFANHACSSGEETLSFAAMFIDKLGMEAAEKLFPIFAFDFDRENIIAAKSGKFSAYADEIYRMKKYLSNPNKYFNFNEKYRRLVENPLSPAMGNPVEVAAKPILTDNIRFFRSNIYDDICRIPDKNVIFSSRNFWLWQSDDQRHWLVDRMSDKFKDTSSLIMIGDADMLATDIHDLLLNKGFDPTEIQYVYARRRPVYRFFN